MAAYEPKNPGYRAAAVAMFDGQPAMHTLGIVIVRLAPGEVELAMLHSPALTQQNGFISTPALLQLGSIMPAASPPSP
ncbi:acyl-coenzyme A thioesterase PaaI-like protein [Bradyrhizobium sp. LM4.3]